MSSKPGNDTESAGYYQLETFWASKLQALISYKYVNHGFDNSEVFAMLNITIPDYGGTTIEEYMEQMEIKPLRVYTNNSSVEVDFSA